MFKSKLNPMKFLDLLPALGALIATVVDALRDGKITDEEIQAIGEKLIVIVKSVVD